jgi:hypothetical protein
MTFISNILTRDDKNNSGSSVSNFIGTPTDLTGYNSIIIEITATTQNETSGTLNIYFSSTGTDMIDDKTKFYTDIFNITTLNGTSSFIKSYSTLKQYYKITCSSTYAININTRLSTQSTEQNISSINSFTNSNENIYDAFGKLRVSFPETLIDLRVAGQDASGLGTTGYVGYRNNVLQITQGYTGSLNIGNTGYISSNNSQCNIYLTTTNGNSGSIATQSRKYCVYQPGKSLLIMLSGIMDGGVFINQTNYNTSEMISNVGYYDDYNGLYFSYKANGSGTGTGYINIKNGGINTSIANTSWNIDKFDGTGQSGLKLNWTKAQLFVIDMEWLGVGRIRFGFYAYGKIQYCHQVSNINLLNLGPYTSNNNLPIRYQLTGGTAGCTGALVQICSTVISEGGYSPIGKPFSIGITGSISNSSEKFILYLRGGNTNGNFYHQQIVPQDISITSQGVSDLFFVKVYLYLPDGYGNLPTINTWTNVNPLSVTEYATSSSVSGSGILVYQSACAGRSSVTLASLSTVFTDLLQITSNINNVSSILGISIQGSFSGNTTYYLSLSWTEIY